MITTTYACDRCKRVVKHPDEQLWNVAVFMEVVPNWPRPSTPARGNAQWCRGCCQVMHLLPRGSSEPSTPELPKPPSFEELVRAIVANEVEQALDRGNKE